MTDRVPFDDFADIYDVWCSSAAPVTDANRRFYGEEYARAGTPVVELGIGDGRVAIEAGRAGVDVTGVDSSREMLALCRERFEREGLADHLRLVEADFLEFELDEPARFVAIPFHTIGALVGLEAKRELFARIYGALAPGGKLVFDHFVCDMDYALRNNGVPALRAEYRNTRTGRETLLWIATSYDFDAQSMRIVSWTDELEDDGRVAERRYRNIDFSWIDPEDTRRLLEETGFEVETLWGSFDRTPFDESSRHQVWVARGPG